MKPLILCLFLFSLSCGAARVETFSLDLERAQQPFALSFTEETDTTVTATLKASGSEFDPSGWICLLWYGTTSGGITLTNSASSYGSATWTVPSSEVPTNGRYSVQVLGVITNVTEEWGRGALTVRLNPAHNSMPVNWMTNSALYSLIVSTSNALAVAVQAESQARVDTNALFAAWFGSLFNSTSRWDTASGWGDWHSSVASNSAAVGLLQTGKLDVSASLAFLTSEADTNALAVISALKAKMRWDVADSNVYDVIEGGTNWVGYRIATVPSATNYIVTLSDNFEETATHTRPAWTNNVFPFTDGDWVGDIGIDELYIFHSGTDNAAEWQSEGLSGYPNQLNVFSGAAQGTATVSRAYTYPTNEIFRVYISSLTNIAAALQSIRASLAFVSNTADQAASDVFDAQSDINNHTAMGTIGYDAHLAPGDRALIDSVPGLATTNALAAVSGALGTHTNDAPAHVSASDRAAWYGVTNLPSAGCTALEVTDATNLVVTGATYAYTADVTNSYWLSIAGTAPAYHYSLTVYGTNDCTLADNMRLIGTKTVTGTNCVSFKPFTNGLWEVLWGGK